MRYENVGKSLCRGSIYYLTYIDCKYMTVGPHGFHDF